MTADDSDGDRLPHGLWESPLDARRVYDLPGEPAYPFQRGTDLYWIQALPDEGGRQVLMRQRQGARDCLTPEPFNIRTRVHEYGGRCFCLHGGNLVFNNYPDGRLYLQPISEEGKATLPSPLTREEPGVLGYADLLVLGEHIVAVQERSLPGRENLNTLVAVKLSASLSEPVTLVAGSDFYASPVVDPDGQWLSWLEWSHPAMPWDASRLMRARLDRDDGIALATPEVVIAAEDTSVTQPGYLEDGSLVFAMDSADADWSNLYRWANGNLQQLTREKSEFGEAHWVFGQCRWAQVEHDRLLAICTAHSGDRLLSVDLGGSAATDELLGAAGLSQLSITGRVALLVVAPEDRPKQVIQVNTETGETEIVGDPTVPLLKQGYSKPVSLSCASGENETAWAYQYPPFHPRHADAPNDLPPVVVMVHGGPTSRSSPAFHPLRQYFAYLGFVVLDVNHRGSTGYGRRFRQRLLGAWGDVDVEDVIACVDSLAERNLIDPKAVFIRGGSAGGYAVLRALTRYPDRFAGGACYYGIGNLVTLAKITHKFESRYTDRLIGEAFDPERALQPDSLFQTRSPLNDIDRLRSPLILFQGLEDRIVPPEVSREVVARLDSRGVRYAYHEYPGEGHGFRKTATRVDSLEREAAFYRQVLEERPGGGAVRSQ